MRVHWRVGEDDDDLKATITARVHGLGRVDRSGDTVGAQCNACAVRTARSDRGQFLRRFWVFWTVDAVD